MIQEIENPPIPYAGCSYLDSWVRALDDCRPDSQWYPTTIDLAWVEDVPDEHAWMLDANNVAVAYKIEHFGIMLFCFGGQAMQIEVGDQLRFKEASPTWYSLYDRFFVRARG